MYDQFVQFGDSITQDSFSQERGFGSGAALAHAYARKMDVVNRGFSGYTTHQGVHLISQIVDSSVKLLAIFFGTNDAVAPEQLQHVPLTQFEGNLRHIVMTAREANPTMHIVMVTPAPLDELDRDMSGRTLLRTHAYAEAVRKLAEELDTVLVDLWPAFMSENSSDVDRVRLAQLLYDGLHFSPAGYRVLYNALLDAIGTRCPEWHPDNMQRRFPSWTIKPAIKFTVDDLTGTASKDAKT